MNKRLIYTVITGDYDEVKPYKRFDGWDYLLITDNENIDPKGWDIKIVPEQENPVKLQRFWKINSHLLGYDLTVYIDGSMTLKFDPIAIATKYLKDQIALVQHPTRKCIIPESEAVISQRKDVIENVRPQIGRYISEGMPFNFGMFASGMLIRKKCKDFEMAWWSEVEKNSHRDQLSLPYVLWKTGVKYSEIPWTTLTSYVNIEPHKQKKELKIWYSNPYSTSKNIGKAYNEFCQIVPNDEDWIVLQDGDMMYLRPDWGQVINETLAKYGEKYQLFGCLTNRLAGSHQLLNSEFSEDFDLLNHIQKAEKIRGIDVKQADGIAGVFMAFQKKTWKAIGGFAENSHTFDTTFSMAVRAKGFKIAVMQGLYVFHQYRPWSKNPKEDVKHLK